MKTPLRSLVLFLAVLLATASEVSAQDLRYTTSAVRMRADATTESRVLVTIPRGARVTVNLCAVDWCSIEYRSRTGYIAQRYLGDAPKYEKRGDGEGYTNSRGNWVPSPRFSPTGPPPGASARCRDGSYSFSQSRRGTCSHHGGVASWL